MSLPNASTQDTVKGAGRNTATPGEFAWAVVNPDGTVLANTNLLSATTPTITNLSVPLANTEVSHVFQTNLKKFLIRSRNAAQMKIAFIATESSTKYITISPSGTYSEDGLNLTGKTLYLQLNSAPGIVEILEWN